ncbi:Uncharacterised protein [Mycobacterium tuberculosis]|uniref:Uncharacterized protein n=1 Tax=Mycobacterium tuberculosis TaxID=1773 RepID=A0A916LBC4_MYCTX|nr:Uncharacterised protein [Mycobacterium tuberculosis]COY01429.1 Uncharacterised protein [Mycobacterium tuberculosis]
MISPFRYLIDDFVRGSTEDDFFHKRSRDLGRVGQNRLFVHGLRDDVLHTGEVGSHWMLDAVTRPGFPRYPERGHLHNDRFQRLFHVVAIPSSDDAAHRRRSNRHWVASGIGRRAAHRFECATVVAGTNHNNGNPGIGVTSGGP